MGGHRFTYMSGAGEKLSKLDRFFVCRDFLERWPGAKLTALTSFLSDHRPLLFTAKASDFGHTPFRFFNSWLELPGFADYVNFICDKFVFDGPADRALAAKLKWLKGRIRLWIAAERAKTDNRSTECRKIIESIESIGETRSLNSNEIDLRLAAKKDLLDFERLKSMDAKQKSRTRWAIDGDENSKFFHNVMRINTASNRIHGVKVGDDWEADPIVIKERAVEFFASKFMDKTGHRPEFVCPGIKKITDEDKSRLEAPFSLEEIKSAVWECDGDKAPGPDGFNFKFIKYFWEGLKLDFLRLFQSFYDTGQITNGCFSAFIALIPKGKDQISFADYRPISLVGCINKVLSKVLVARLKSVMPKLISDEQTAFLGNRNILDGPIMLNETIACMKKNKSQGMFFKVDIEKAYDSLNWDFLEDMLCQMNFSSKWRGWIMSIVKNARTSVLVNGSPTYEFDCQRGLRQGDPISPFLFILAMEALTCIMNRAVLLGVFHGLRVNGNGPILSHFIYADDVVFCGEWSAFNARNIKRLLRCFFLISGLRINLRKCCVYGVGVRDVEVQGMASILGCSAGSFPFMHLGIPISANMNLVRNWSPIIDKFKDRLSLWKSKSLSYGGRITLLKSVLNSLPLYYFSLFRAPLQVIKSLERIRRTFFWGGNNDADRLSWIAWENVIAPMEYGGAGLGSLRDANLSLLTKWWWRFKVDVSGMWRKVIWAIHGGSRAWNKIPAKLSISGPWKQIAAVPGVLESFNVDTRHWFKGIIGCGSSIMFWLDYWIGDELLSTSFPSLFALERSQHCSVADRVWSGPSGVGFTWNWRRAGLSDVEAAELNELVVFLGDVALNGSKDRWAFTPNGLCGFSVSTVKLLISENRQYQLQSQFAWSRWVPKKVSVVAWRANLDRLPTAAALQRRNIHIVNDLCNFCQLQTECTEHVFTGCPFVLEVWQQVWRWCNIPSQLIFHVRDVLGIHKSAMSGHRQRETLYAVVLTTFWSVWRARNEVVFSHKEPSVQTIVDEIKVMSFLWIRNRAAMGNMTWEAWRRFDTCKMGKSGLRL